LGEPDTQAATAGFSVTRLGEVRDAARALRAAAEQAR
jgi:hypothetical protein